MPKRADLEKKLKDYLKLYPNEYVTINAMIKFLNTYPDCFERNNLFGHFTGSAWIVDDTHNWILMTHHRQLNRWLQPGGHADGNPDLLYVAINEAREETGLTKLKVKSDKIFDLDIHNIPKFNNVPQHFHYDIRFILETKRKPNEIIISKESYDVAWIHRSAVLTKNNENSIKRMLNKSAK